MDKPRRITILGATGSIGRQALEVVRESEGRLRVHGLAANSDVDGLASQALELRPAQIALADQSAAAALRRRLAAEAPDWSLEILSGAEGVLTLAACDDVDAVLNAIVGAAGLLPSLSALEAGKLLALANKESLVMAGSLVMEKAAQGGTLVPVDSEHSSLFRCARGRDSSEIRAVTLTGSGGAFRTWSPEQMKEVTPEQALKHPVWRMGDRITVDSATMMNKALEVIEAQHLLNLDPSRIQVVVHPQAFIHGLVELGDGTLLAHLSQPDMKIPIAYALYYPWTSPLIRRPLDLGELGRLEFEKPDHEKFPCLELGYRAARDGGTMPAVLNAADEVAVEAFLEGRIQFTDIAKIVCSVMDDHEVQELHSVDLVLEADRWARDQADSLARA